MDSDGCLTPSKRSILQSVKTPDLRREEEEGGAPNKAVKVQSYGTVFYPLPLAPENFRCSTRIMADSLNFIHNIEFSSVF